MLFFYPYYNTFGDNLYMVCKYDANSKQIFKDSLYLTLPNNEQVKVQPFFVGVYMYNMDDNSKLKNLFTGTSQYLEIEAKLTSLNICGYSMSEDDEIWGTYGNCNIKSFEDINVLRTF